MRTIKFILLIIVGLLGWYAIRKLKGTVFIIFALVLCLMGLSFVLFPDFSTTIARIVGVKRGDDMLFYLGFILMFIIIIRMYAKMRSLEDQITALARKAALKDAE
jgi:hypothetical protein